MQTVEEESRALVIADDKQVLTGAKNNTTQGLEEKVTSDERYWFLQNIEEHTVEEKCKNCQSFPCLDGKPVTSENFVNNAYFKGLGTMGPMHGYTYIENIDNTFEICGGYEHNPGQNFTQIFDKNVKSLRFSCHK